MSIRIPASLPVWKNSATTRSSQSKNPPKSAWKSVLEVLDADSDNIISSDKDNEIIYLAEEEEEGDEGEEGGIDKEDFSSCNP